MERTDDPSSSTQEDGSNESTPSDAPDLPAVAEALAGCVREALERGEATEVPGLGAFRVEHQSSQMKEEADQVSIDPPRDEIIFEPAEE